ncbi:hypothetical protein OGAPHI_000906 [Ogataea philodendri]|uniref:Uracil-DNA glycosylase-like domain-containing protein n=1 Tax=Ogataea philodendri TaxID=1378263 RepID=A0A9P8PEI4_9ASCO|nr:uncharacterized protein OGAPHI_000906 [Ogataea philodendri]KAH3670391.1 hypothetical protein OGAPHI_000906 [Ogataea philodendri]
MLEKYKYTEKVSKTVLRSRRKSGELPPLPKLADLNPSLQPDLSVVFIGYNPSIRSSSAQHHYAHPTNLFWKLFNESQILRVATDGKYAHPCSAQDDWGLVKYGIGFTDLVLRPTQNASQLTKQEIKENVPRLCAELKEYRPMVACFVGKGIWEHVLKNIGQVQALKEFRWGRQEIQLEGCDVFVIPSTSGLVSLSYQEKLKWWLQLRDYLSGVRSARLQERDCSNVMVNRQFSSAGEDVPKMKEIAASDIERLVDLLDELYEKKSAGERVIVAVCGSPGSGKTSVTNIIIDRFNSRHGRPIGLVVPQDGFHYSMKELMGMDDPQLMVARRGAEFTFDAQKLVELVRRIKAHPSEMIYAPSFDHKLKDPVNDAIKISPEKKVILVEGNYVCLEKEPWNVISKLVDTRWMVAANLDQIRERIIKRHLEAGISSTREEAEARTDHNDMVNGEYIRNNSCDVDLIIRND